MVILKDKVYDVLRWIAQLVLPASAALYFGLSGTWNLPFTDEIVGTIVATNVWLGALLGLSNMQYQRQKMKAVDPVANVNENSTFPFKMSADLYNTLKWVILTLSPATAALYCAVAKFWGFPFGTEVVASVGFVTAFFGAIFGFNSLRRA